MAGPLALGPSPPEQLEGSAEIWHSRSACQDMEPHRHEMTLAATLQPLRWAVAFFARMCQVSCAMIADLGCFPSDIIAVLFFCVLLAIPISNSRFLPGGPASRRRGTLKRAWQQPAADVLIAVPMDALLLLLALKSPALCPLRQKAIGKVSRDPQTTDVGSADVCRKGRDRDGSWRSGGSATTPAWLLF